MENTMSIPRTISGKDIKPLYKDFTNEQISFNTMKEFGEVTKIECFDTIIIKYDNFSGYER